MKTFIQFYDFEYYNNTLWLRNSFSSVWKVIKEMGNIIWIDPTKDVFPDVNGDIYISCTFEQEIIYIEKWMKLRPDINFIVGGPSIVYSGYNIVESNFNLKNETMYELLNVKPTTDLWGVDIPYDLEIPKEINNKNTMRIGYTYALSYGHRCYWGKCTFCKTNLRNELVVDVKNIPDVKSQYNSIVWLNTQAITPKNILDLFPNFNKKSHYSFYIRGDNIILNTLDKVEVGNNLIPVIGVELPSDRMLNLMNKGTDIKTMLEVILRFLQSGNLTIFTTINGWPELEKSDVESVEYFLSIIEPYKKKIICINHWLFSYEEKENMTLYTTKYNKPYYAYKLTQAQEELNNEILNLYRNFGFFSFKDHLDSKHQSKVNYFGLD